MDRRGSQRISDSKPIGERAVAQRCWKRDWLQLVSPYVQSFGLLNRRVRVIRVSLSESKNVRTGIHSVYSESAEHVASVRRGKMERKLLPIF